MKQRLYVNQTSDGTGHWYSTYVTKYQRPLYALLIELRGTDVKLNTSRAREPSLEKQSTK